MGFSLLFTNSSKLREKEHLITTNAITFALVLFEGNTVKLPVPIKKPCPKWVTFTIYGNSHISTFSMHKLLKKLC